MSRWFVRLLAAALVVLAASPAGAEWRRVDTPNFVVVGDVGEGTLKNIAVKFEAFRETLSRVLTARATTTAVPTLVIVFPSDKAFTPYKPTFNGKPIELAGVFVPGQDANAIALLADGNPEGMRVVFHEYAHLVVSNVTQTIPVWLNEGLAEYYSTFELAGNRKSAVLGGLIPSHLYLLAERTMLPFRELLSIDHDSRHYNEGNQRTVFYAQSWALTHMLLQGQPDRRPQAAAYLTATSRGVSPAEAWQQAFGDEDLERPLRAYVRQRSFTAVRYEFSEKVAAFKAAAVKLSPADADAYLAAFLLQRRQVDQAAALLAGRKQSGTSPWLETVTARVEHEQGKTEEARARLARVDPGTDWVTAYFAGVGLAEVAGRGATSEQVAAIARQFARVTELHGEVPHALVRQALVELDAADVPPAATAEAVARARALAPGRVDYAFVQARLQARQHAFEQARTTMGPLMSRRYPEPVRESARSFMQYLVGFEAYEKARAAAAAAGAAVESGARPVEPTDMPDALPRELTPEERAARAEAARAAADEPIPLDTLRTSEVTSLYRDVKPGETRIEATLTAIRCDSSGGAAFVLSTAGGEQEITTPRMGDVDFITYRDDLTGSVACGQLATPMRVYLTSRAEASTPGGTVVVAVEFLPK